MAAALACAVSAQASVVMETVPVGNAGNAPDTRFSSPGFGAVNYAYNIGKYEVTAGQYTEFLNAVAATDTYGLYNPDMLTGSWACGIAQSGSPGSYTYSVGPDWANRPSRLFSEQLPMRCTKRQASVPMISLSSGINRCLDRQAYIAFCLNS